MDTLISFFLSIRWQDIVDVLFNSYILFRFYILFRGTNVIRVIVGIALLWIVQRIALSIGLIVTSWALQGIIAGAALIIIIVFRNEIRNVLQAKNLRAILWGFPQKSVRTPIESIIEGVYELARNRVGALIVLPGKEDLEELLQGGVEWNGLVSREMLGAIFWSGNPVHDGAAVIQGNQVKRVGAVLPLSTREDLPRYYGTRHRAAVGLAEKTDALIIVVSEERGKVITVKGNTFHPVNDNLALHRILADHLGMWGEQAGTLQKERREALLAALVCIFCMGAVWFSFARGVETLTSLEVPLEYMNRDPRMQITSTSVNTVRLHLAGSGALISSLRPDQVNVKVDLNAANNGENAFNITEQNIALPPGVRINRIEPPSVQVALDMAVNRELPIQVDWVGALPPGLILESVVLSPSKTMISGPQRLMERMATIYTEKIQLGDLKVSGRATASLAFGSASLKAAEGQPDKVEIRYTIRKRSP